MSWAWLGWVSVFVETAAGSNTGFVIRTAFWNNGSSISSRSALRVSYNYAVKISSFSGRRDIALVSGLEEFRTCLNGHAIKLGKVVELLAVETFEQHLHGKELVFGIFPYQDIETIMNASLDGRRARLSQWICLL